MTHSALWLSQAQFFMSLAFMLLFLLLEIGLAWALAFFKLRALAGDERWTQAYRFWVRPFALAFVLTFASAVPVMAQFGSLWPVLMDRIGNVASPLLAAAVLTVFVFKSSVAGAMLFGRRHVSERVHTALVVIAAIGVTVAVLLPIVLFSWMHTPAGAVFADGRYVVTDWHSIFFNPAFPWYAGLLVALSMVTACLFMLGVSSLQSLRRSLSESDKAVFGFAARGAVLSLVVLAVVAIMAGHALAEHEPARAAAATGYWQSGKQPSFAILAVPDAQGVGDRWAWRWHGKGGPFLARDVEGRYRGLDQFSGMAPPMGLTFWSLRIALFSAAVLLLASVIACWRLRQRGGDPASLSMWLRKVLVVAGFGGWLVALAGFTHIVFGAYPYAIAGTVTLSEVLAEMSVPVLLTGSLALFIVYAVCIAGFFQLLWHGVRYGVVPVARRRGRA